MKTWVVPGIVLIAATASGCGIHLTNNNDGAKADEPVATKPVRQRVGVEELSPYWLEYVRKSGPSCSSTWSAGSTLPVDYEWCKDDTGLAVAGPRIGSCEVVTYKERFYAVPGYRIHRASGRMWDDPGYVDELTSCKRTPRPADAGRGAY